MKTSEQIKGAVRNIAKKTGVNILMPIYMQEILSFWTL